MKFKNKHHKKKMQNQKLVPSLSHRNAVEPESLGIFRGCDEQCFQRNIVRSFLSKNNSKLINCPVSYAGDFFPLLNSYSVNPQQFGNPVGFQAIWKGFQGIRPALESTAPFQPAGICGDHLLDTAWIASPQVKN